MMKARDMICRPVFKPMLLLVAVRAFFSCSAAGKSNLSPDQTQPANHIYVIGHRGAAGLAPENTLAAFNKACETGVDVVELMKNKCNLATERWVEIKTNPEKPALTRAPETVVDAVMQALKKQDFAGRARILFFDWRALVHVQKTATDIPTPLQRCSF